VFCWQCGATLMQQAPSTAIHALGVPAAGDPRDATVAMDALLASDTHASRGRGEAARGTVFEED
jgi:hypothetical protein